MTTPTASACPVSACPVSAATMPFFSIKNLRTYRILGLAIFDWAFSLIAAFIIGKYVLQLGSVIDNKNQWLLWLAFWVLLGIFVHKILNIPTMLGYYLGLNKKPEI